MEVEGHGKGIKIESGGECHYAVKKSEVDEAVSEKMAASRVDLGCSQLPQGIRK